MESDPDTVRTFASFEEFVKSRPVFATFENELQVEGANALKPLERSEREDAALADDIEYVVANRSGSVLSASTILKSDFFSNLQKMSLPERIDGAANFRRIPLTLGLTDTGVEGKFVCGSGMPTVDGYVAAAHLPRGSKLIKLLSAFVVHLHELMQRLEGAIPFFGHHCARYVPQLWPKGKYLNIITGASFVCGWRTPACLAPCRSSTEQCRGDWNHDRCC
jgi:hypothetical protein